MSAKLDSSINLRVSTKDRNKFEKKCAAIGMSSTQLLRQCITAFVDDRLKITPTPDQLKSQELYQ